MDTLPFEQYIGVVEGLSVLLNQTFLYIEDARLMNRAMREYIRSQTDQCHLNNLKKYNAFCQTLSPCEICFGCLLTMYEIHLPCGCKLLSVFLGLKEHYNIWKMPSTWQNLLISII